MKQHVKKKQRRRNNQILAAKGYINQADGIWCERGRLPDSSMRRDYYPQRLTP